MSPRTVVRAFAYRVSARGVSAGLQAVALVVLARDLGVSQFGQFVLGVSVGGVLNGAISLGIPMRALRLSREPDAATIAQTMLNAAVVAAGVTGVLVYLLLAHLLSASAVVSLSAGVVVASDQVAGVVQAVLAGRQRQRASANVVLLQRVAPVIGLGLAVAASGEPLGGYGVGAAVLALTLACAVIRPQPVSQWAAVVRGSWGYTLTTLSGMLPNLDVTVVRIVTDARTVGQYGAATRLVSPLSIVVSTFLTILVPTASNKETVGERHNLFRRAFRAIALVSLGLTLASPAIAYLVVWVLGPGYRGAFPTVIAVVVGVGISAISQVVQAQLVTEGRATRVGVAVGAGTVIGLVALAFAGGVAGPTAIWIGPIVTQTAVLALLWSERRRWLRLEQPTAGGPDASQ